MSTSKFSEECVDLLLAGLLFFFFFCVGQHLCDFQHFCCCFMCWTDSGRLCPSTKSLFQLFMGAVLLCLLELGQLVSPSLTLSLLLCSCQYGDFGLF